MSIINNGLLLAAEAAAAPVTGISRSLRFNSADSAYLNRTPGTAGNRKTWTWAGWVKRSNDSGYQVLFSANNGNSTAFDIAFNGNNFGAYLGIGPNLVAAAVYRDFSAWYHILCAVDTTQATASSRIKLYVNGQQIAAFSASNYPSQNFDYDINNTTAHAVGRVSGVSSGYFPGYLADIHFIDGQALDPSSFGEFDTNGVWQPIAYAGSYGTNGFHLPFSDNSGTSSTTLGKDAAGSNNWTPNNFSVAAGAGNDSLVDVPVNGDQTDTGIGGEVRGNYAAFNALALNGNTLSNGNLDYLAGSANKPTLTTIGIPNTGKWYFEFTDVDSTGSFTAGVGTASVGVSSYLGADANGWGYQTHPTNAGYHNSGVFTTTGRINGAGSNTIVGIAIDRDAQKIWFSVNGTFVNSGVPASGTNAQYSNLPTSGELFPGASTGSSQNIVYNAGQRPFAYTAPSGFKALCTTNLPEPTIADGSTAMDAALYTGNGSTQTISGLNFSPDFVWLKRRSSAQAHYLYDVIRGTSSVLFSDGTDAEQSISTGLTAFNSDGFSLGSLSGVNASSTTYVAWTWDAGSSTVTNTQGSVTSQVRANASAGFSVVTYTGAGSAGTIGHGLGAAPSLVIVKMRSVVGGGSNWQVYHASIGNTSSINLNTTGTPNSDIGWWNNTSPTSTVYSVGTYNASSLYDFVAYCFAPVAGYSSFDSYTGNGSATDNTFVYTGMRPRFVMLKRSDSTGNWVIWDAVRNSYNVANSIILPNTSAAEYSPDAKIDILSNGFKVRDNSSDSGTNGATYIYAAFAENPFATSRAR
jgi:hypothetical protein